eukprot:UN34412
MFYYFKEMTQYFDTDSDGMINFEEFSRWVKIAQGQKLMEYPTNSPAEKKKNRLK